MSVRVDLGGRRIIKKTLFGKYTAFSLLFAVMKSACLCTGFIRATTYVKTGPDAVDDTAKVVFFKQKTEYEIRIRDWSSDVCSSD
eukprot:COSAG03_NODE_23342_length_281_cov_0.450549_1_plen_84_part_01